MDHPTHEHVFVRYLIGTVKENRAAKAALRRSLGRAPGEAPEAFRYVVPILPGSCDERTEAIYYLVAGLYALHPQHTASGNLGDHLRGLAGANEQARERLERYLMAALRAHPNDLSNHLRRLVGILKAKDIPINWHQLMWDLLDWVKDDHRAQKRWANGFWRQQKSVENQPTSADDGDAESTFDTDLETE